MLLICVLVNNQLILLRKEPIRSDLTDPNLAAFNKCQLQIRSIHSVVFSQPETHFKNSRLNPGMIVKKHNASLSVVV